MEVKFGVLNQFKNTENEPYEKFHIKFMKEILGLHCKTSNNACRSELGRLPLKAKIMLSSMKFLDHLISFDKILAHDIFIKTRENNIWTSNMKKCIQKSGLLVFNIFSCTY